jgi:hypothetical protein
VRSEPLVHDAKKLALGLDPGAATGFTKRSWPIKMPERQSMQSETIAL